MVMDYNKLNNEILKAYSKGDRNKENIMIGIHENDNSFNDILISFNGHNLYVVPDCFFPFDVAAITEGYLNNHITLNNNLYKCISGENEYDYYRVGYDYTKYLDKCGKKLECSIFKCGDSFKIGVNAGFLKYFNLDNCIIKAKSSKSPLMIYDKNDRLLALILPINFNQEEL